MTELAPLAVCLPLVGAALLVAIFARLSKRAVEIAATLTATATLALCVAILANVARHGAYALWFGNWHPGNAVGLGIAFVIDPAGAAVATCVAAIVTGAVLFSRQYFDEVGAIFYVLLLAMLGAMVAFAYAADAFDLFVFYEVFSVAAYALSAYRVEVKSAYQGALQFALVNSVAGLFILGGIIVLEARTGELNLAAIGRSLPAQHASTPLLAVSFAFVAIGLFTRGALAPLHFWFDEVHASAPTPLCVVLSGAMVPLALFGFLRLYLVAFSTALPPSAGPALVLCVVGTLSAVVGSAMCLRQTKLKRMLAFSTVAHAGVAAAALSTFSTRAFAGAALYFGGYAFGAAGLFMAVAAVRSRTGRPVGLFDCAGAGRRLYVTATVFALGTCEVAGIWPSARAIVWGSSGWRGDLTLALFAGVALATGGACLRALRTIFLVDRGRPGPPSDVPWFMLAPAAAFVAVPLAVAFFPPFSAFVLRSASGLLDVEGYRALAFGSLPSPRAGGAIPDGTPLAWLAALGAALGGYACVGRARALRLARIVAGRNPGIGWLARVHDGDVGAYVAWIVGSAAVLAACVVRAAR